MLNLGIIGYGYWGPNISRNFYGCNGAKLVSICDLKEDRLELALSTYPGVKGYSDPKDLIKSDEIQAVAVVTPVFSHYELTKAALESGKHVFVEKPFTSNTRQAEDLINLAHKKGLLIMVDHTFLFTGAVRKIREIIDLSSENDVTIELTNSAELNEISATGHHQGIIAYVKPPKDRSLKRILAKAGKDVCVLLLDQVQDPHNLGAILRTAESTGIDGVIIPRRRSVDITPAVHRVSMGGSIYVPVLKMSLYSALKLLKEEGIRVIGVDPSGSIW